MADTLFNKVINEEIKVNVFIKWLLEADKQEQKIDEFSDCRCSQSEFLTYFLNFVHEEIPCQNRCGDRDPPQKVRTPRRIELRHNEEALVKKTPSSITNLDKMDLNRSASYPLSLNKPDLTSLGKCSLTLGVIKADDSSTPKIIKIQSDCSLNNSYVSPISPLYRQQNSFTTPKTRKSEEKVTPLCLGDFIIHKISSSKKKASRNLLANETMDESSRRINPTSLSQVTVNSDFRKTENSFNNFENTQEVSAESLNENRNFLAEERLKILSRKDSGDNLVGASKSFINAVNFKVEQTPDVNCVTHKAQLDLVAEVYVCVLNNNLALNITSEIYFLISLLLNRQLGSKECEETTNSTSGDDSYVGVDFLNEADKSDLLCTAKRKVSSSDLFETIHNIMYFAVRCLESQLDVLMYYDKATLKLLSQNKRLGLFAGSFAEKLCRVADKKPERVLELAESDLQTNVCFNLDTDNRENFPSECSFHAFRKQRDLFYEILRIWENGHMLTGWNFGASLTGKIKSLLGLQNESANFMHLARLFKAQLLSTCGKSQKEEGLTDKQMPFLSSLPNVDASKLNRLKSRLVTKQSSNGINSLPSFPGHQQFYRQFIVVAASYAFNKHLCDTFVAEIVELNDTKFSYTGWDDSDGAVDDSTRKAFSTCLESLRVLAKFLGYVESLPYQSACTNYSLHMLSSHLNVRRQTNPSFDVKRLLIDSQTHNSSVLTVPWVAEYLAMLDYVTLRLPYYVSVHEILFDMYKNCDTSMQASKGTDTYNISLVRFCLGWLFELPHFPDSGYFSFCTGAVSSDVKQSGRQKRRRRKSKDAKVEAPGGVDIVDQNILYMCCPYLEGIKKVLSSNEQNSSVTVKHITPVTAVHSSNEIAQKRLERQLEEAFFNGQPVSVRKTVEFVSERIASSCVKHMCHTIVPDFKKAALDDLKCVLKTWKKEHDAKTPKKKKYHKAGLRPKVNKITQTKLLELRERCEKEAQSVTNERIPASVNSLLAMDVLPQMRGVCVAIATKMCLERVGQWINTHVTSSVFSKDFEGEIQKVAGLDGKKAVKEKTPFALPAGGIMMEHNEDATSAFHMLEKIRELTVQILEGNASVDDEMVSNTLREAHVTLTERCDANDCIANTICSVVFDLSLLIITHKPHLIALVPEVRKAFVRVWRCYRGKPGDLCKNLLCVRNIMIFSQSGDGAVVWKHLASFVAFLIKEKMLTCDDFEYQCTSFFKREWDQSLLKNLTIFLHTFIDCYKSNGGCVDKFVLLLEFLSDFCTDL